jgi:predicted TIM-barrel fold metal-dependent hydrolase
MRYPTRFSGLHDLARLPWFEVRDSRLVVADPTVGPAIDVHTHLALAYGAPPSVDLTRLTDEALHYLPKERAIDLDVYINRNFSAEDLKRLNHDLVWKSVTSTGMRATHTLPNLQREMRECNVSHAVLLAIDFPILSRNSEWWLDTARSAKEILCFGSVHPLTRNPAARLDALVARGARGVKVHPTVQLIAPDHPLSMRIYPLCGARKLPVLFHCGPVGIEPALGRRLTQVSRYERALAENPDTQFVLGHSGALQMPEALGLALKYPNTWLEVSSQSLTNVERLMAECPPERLLFGTDWPFYHQAIGLAKVFIAAGEDEALRRRVLSENARRLFGLS